MVEVIQESSGGDLGHVSIDRENSMKPDLAQKAIQ